MRALAILMAAGALSVGALSARALVSTAGPADGADRAILRSTAGSLDISLNASSPVSLAALHAEAVRKCGRLPDGWDFAVMLDRVLVVGPGPMDELDAFEWPEVGRIAANDMICRPEWEQLGIEADAGFYLLTRETGAHFLRDALREIHALQETHWGEHGRWAESLEALGYTLPDPALTIEIRVREDGETWTGRGTHAVDIRRCSVSGWGALRAEAHVERHGSPECRRLAPDDEAFPRLIESGSGSR